MRRSISFPANACHSAPCLYICARGELNRSIPCSSRPGTLGYPSAMALHSTAAHRAQQPAWNFITVLAIPEPYPKSLGDIPEGRPSLTPEINPFVSLPTL